MKVTVKVRQEIVGYSMIRIYSESTEGTIWYAKCLKAVTFPKIEGNYQAVSSKYIERQFGQIETEYWDGIYNPGATVIEGLHIDCVSVQVKAEYKDAFMAKEYTEVDFGWENVDRVECGV